MFLKVVIGVIMGAIFIVNLFEEEIEEEEVEQKKKYIKVKRNGQWVDEVNTKNKKKL